jgi:hypothetical protein
VSSGGIYFLFSPSGKLKTVVLIPTSKTLTRRDLNLNNALRKRKTPPELKSLSAEPLHTPHSKLIRSYSEAVSQSSSKSVAGKGEKVSLSERGFVSQSVSQGISFASVIYYLPPSKTPVREKPPTNS